MKLAKEIDKRAEQHDIVMEILIQINPAQEESKFGVKLEDAEGLIREILDTCKHVKISGLMCVAPMVENPDDVRPYFSEVKALYDKLAKIDHEGLEFKYLSMGMSHDYKVAMEEGANIVRVGSAIFGQRVY